MEPSVEPKPEKSGEEHKEKTYVQSKKKWTEFDIHPEIITLLKEAGKIKPTRIQQETLPITTNPDRKKFSMIIRSSNGSGKTLCYLIPILNSIRPGIQVSRDKTLPNGKTLKNEVFMPQAIILVMTAMLMQQIEEELVKLQVQVERSGVKHEKVNFTIGRMDREGHRPGDIVLAMPKSFANRHANKNVKLDNCAFIAIDEVDEIYEQGQQELENILQICEEAPNLKLIVCSATMKKQFKEFFAKNTKNCIEMNLNDILRDEIGHTITLEGVTNYINVIEGDEAKYKYILNDIFKELYGNTTKLKPKVFIFFNAVSDIENFKKLFEESVRDMTNPNVKYLQGVSLGVIAGYRTINGSKVEVPINERRKIITDFRNGEFKVLLATNIVARGIDIRDVCFVINVDAPREGRRENSVISIDTYLHRVGRTGRHSDRGVALTLVDQRDQNTLVESVKRIHKVEIRKLESLPKIVEEVERCIYDNDIYKEPPK